MEFKNTWTRIAARWEENKSFKDLLMQAYENEDGPYMSGLQGVVDKIIGIDYVLTTFASNSGFGDGLSKRLQKFSDAYIDTSNNTLGYYLSDLLNTDYESSVADAYWLANKHETIQEYINKNKFLLDNASNYINEIYNTINKIQVNDDIEKAQKQKVLQTIKIKGDKLVKSCNNFKMLLKNDFNENNFKPFYVIKRYADGYYLPLDGDMHNEEIEDYKFADKEHAEKILQKLQQEFPDEDFSADSYDIIYISNQKENADFEKNFNRNQFN